MPSMPFPGPTVEPSFSRVFAEEDYVHEGHTFKRTIAFEENCFWNIRSRPMLDDLCWKVVDRREISAHDAKQAVNDISARRDRIANDNNLTPLPDLIDIDDPWSCPDPSSRPLWTSTTAKKVSPLNRLRETVDDQREELNKRQNEIFSLRSKLNVLERDRCLATEKAIDIAVQWREIALLFRNGYGDDEAFEEACLAIDNHEKEISEAIEANERKSQQISNEQSLLANDMQDARRRQSGPDEPLVDSDDILALKKKAAKSNHIAEEIRKQDEEAKRRRLEKALEDAFAEVNLKNSNRNNNFADKKLTSDQLKLIKKRTKSSATELSFDDKAILHKTFSDEQDELNVKKGRISNIEFQTILQNCRDTSGSLAVGPRDIVNTVMLMYRREATWKVILQVCDRLYFDTAQTERARQYHARIIEAENITELMNSSPL